MDDSYEIYESTPAVEMLVAEILSSHQLVTLIIDSKLRPSTDDGDVIHDVLTSLFRSILEELSEEHGEDAVAAAAEMFCSAGGLIIEHVHVVPPELLRRAEQRAARQDEE